MKKLKIIILLLFCFLTVGIKAKALEDGIYTIHSVLNKEYVLDVSGGVAKNGSNLQIYKYNGTAAQKFKVTNLGNDYYSIASMINSNYVVDLDSNKYANNANIQMFNSNNTTTQKWTIKQTGDGTYIVLSSDHLYSMDVNGAQTYNGNNIKLYTYNGNNAQKFIFKKVFFAEKSIDSGLYTISTALSENLVLDNTNDSIKNGNNIQIYSNSSHNAQRWYVKHLGNGYYSINSYKDLNYVLDVAGGGKSNGTNLQLYKSNNTNAQKWIISAAGDGYYNIVSKDNNLAIDIANGLAKKNNNVWLYNYNNSLAQKFKFSEVEEDGSRSVDDGYYFINTSLDSKKVLDIHSGNVSSENNIQLYDLNYSLAQKWYIKYVDNGYYAILSDKDNNYSLEYDENNNVRINNYNNADNQKWIIRENNGSYHIIASNNKYLDVDCASIKNGTNIKIYSPNGTTAQKYSLKKTASGLSKNVIKNGIYRISSAIDNSMVLDLTGGSKNNGANIQLYKTNGSNAQKWKVEYQSNGYYKISSLIDLTKVFDVAGGKAKINSNVHSYENNNSLAQQWLIKDAGDEYYYIVSNCGGYNLDVDNGSTHNGTNIKIFSENGTKAQKFKFIPTMEDTKVIDVSEHQGKITWDDVYNTGIYGVILRIGYWQTEDFRFNEYINEVKRLGIPYGIYIFSYASTTYGANVEADFTKSIINKYNLDPTLGIYYDIEDWYIAPDNTSNILSKDDYDNIISTYINNVSSSVGSKYKVKVYANSSYALNRFNDYARREVDWLADYRGYRGYTGPVSLWQYTSSAKLDGINGYVDMSYLQ